MKVEEQQRILEDWLTEHRGLFFKIVRAYAFKTHDQDDLFQEIVTQVFHSIPKFRGDSKVTTWVYRIALYSAMSWSKKERRHRDNHQAIEDHQNALLQASKSRNPRLDWLYDQIAQLEKVDRSLTLMMLDGYSYKEISTTLGLSESNVGVKLNRIKKRLVENSNKELKNGH